MQDFVANAGTILLAVFGISLLIFVHEAGHFLAARLFKVRVEVFSLGFGPRLFGWNHGDTDYRISAFPLGGYVKMAGEYNEYTDETERAPQEDDLNNKPIWQRFIIFAAGPAVNFLLAFVLFPIGFAIGAPFVAPVIGDIAPGGSAWTAGLQPGDELVSVNDNRVYGLSDVWLEIALSDPNDTTAVVRRDGNLLERRFALQRSADDSRYDLGISAFQLPTLQVREDGPATKAGLQEGDILTGVEDLQIGTFVEERLVTTTIALSQLVGRPKAATLHVERDGEPLSFVVEPSPIEIETATPMLGAAPASTRIHGLRRDAEAPSFPLHMDDIVMRVGEVDVVSEKELRAAIHALQATGNPGSLHILREGTAREIPLGEQLMASLLERDVSFTQDLTGPLRIQVVDEGSLDQAGMQDGDLILSLNEMPLSNFTELKRFIESQPNQVDYTVNFMRHGDEEQLTVRARPLLAYDFGIAPTTLEVVYDMSFLSAMKAGFDSSINSIRNTALTLGKLFTGEVGTENLGGPIAISVITYEAAKWDFAKLLMFLAALSVNLGLINILPIPVLDGGQIIFLLCEKVKGSRLSERFMQNAQLAGFVAILALMVYVTFNDFTNFI
ncbi:MAG: RIP metalloprotease RseP [Planctomycetota bacterium]|nr:RIP metalloprotease RseP [Planctomycetota bacterium]